MDEYLFEALYQYYEVLCKTGYMPQRDTQKLLILSFYIDYIMHDYRGVITNEDYHLMEKALDCLYGTSCLIPYPDYLKMGKLKLGAMVEMAQRMKNIEETEVAKFTATDTLGTDSDVVFVDVEE